MQHHNTHVQIADLYAQALKDYPSHTSITLLHVGEHKTVVAYASDKETMKICSLNMGLQNVGSSSSDTVFQKYPPTALELENAIMVVEDEIMPLAKLLPHPSTLILTDEITYLLKLVAGYDKSILSIDDVEDLFRRLAEVSEGSPMLSSGLPMRSDFAAAVLIVREFMHHLGFESVILSQTTETKFS